jgi:hypothetical protein
MLHLLTGYSLLASDLLASRRSGPDGLHAFMGCGDLEGGEAWTFTCPPGHRIVGYGGSTREGDGKQPDIIRIRFVTCDFGGVSS